MKMIAQTKTLSTASDFREQVHGEHGDDAAEHGQPQPQRDIHAETPASVGALLPRR
ncbi:hypothetical protein [Blastococcus sp. MG754427]|uniref:hypothetical protein n=1 Tax=Blastococcus sp. MG754427 TaxID=2570318 RepID=UPI001F3194D8|nr:hypothetical protein [Blastococcus sp. MG754427]